uniref:Plectin-like isoform X7 n=1 Tax=Petromyzon marinus TaxID=7757 RepID=A0AAJ7TCP9_PETMA|nr:plectin-like isoform X7 [Petromyzon marinus]
MAAGMLMPLDKLRSIYEALFRDGVMVAKKDRRPDSIHQELVGVTNLQVSRAMASLKSRGFVRETFTWRHHYWYLSNEGIGYLRDYLHLPPEIVPVTLHRVRQPLPASLPGRRPQTGPLGAGRGRGTARAYGGDDRENYRSGTQAQAQARAIPEGKDGGASVRKVESAGLGSAQSFEFRGGYVRPSRASLPPAKAVEDDDERERVQKKTFTKWVNSHLVKSKRQVNDLYEDLRDGHNLISLLELLSGEMLPRERGSMLVHKMQNIKIALDFMQRRQIKLVNIRSDDIAEGNPKLTLGLIWTIILHFQVSDIQVGEQHRDLGAKERLLLWVRRVVQEYPDLRCDNFTTSWRDGRLFNAIIHRHRPDLLDMKKVYQQNNQQNLEQAFSLAEQNLRVPRLLDTEDVDVKSPEEKSLVTYVAALYEAFPKIPADGITIYEVDKKWKEYETKISFLLSWIKEKMQKVESQGSTMSREELKDFQILLLQLKEKDIPGRDGERASIEKLYKALQVWIDFGRIKVTPGQSPADVEKELGKLVKAIQAGETKAQQETSRLAKFAAASKPAAGPVDEIKVIEAQSVQAPLMQFQEQVKIPADIATKAKAAQAEAKAKAQREAKERERVDQEARALAEAIGREQLEAKAKEAEARAKAQEEAKAKAKAEQEAKEKAKAEAAAKEAQAKEAAAKAKAEEEARAKAKAEQEAKERAKAEAQAKEAAAKAKAEEEARAKAKAEQEAKERAKAEAQAKEAAAKAKAEEEARAKAKAEQEAKERAKAEAQAKEAAAKAKAEEEARAKAKAEQEAKEKAKAEAAAKEEQAKEAEAKAKAQEEARAKAKAEALAKAQEEEKARLIAQQQTKVRIQADAAAKALADSIAKQQEEAKAKEAEAKEREAVKAKEAEDARLRVEAEARALAESLSKAQAEGKAKEAEAKAQAEADQKLNFIKDLMALMEEKQMEIESADWGIDLSSVGANLQSHKNLHQVLEGLNTKVVEAQAYESKVPASRKKNYTDSLAALTATYNKSLAASGVRSTRLQELLAFLAPAEAELAWAKGQETEQLERDWSDKNADMEAQRKSLDASQKKLNEKQPIFADIKKLGEKLLSDKHPAKSTIEASLEGLGAQWAWLTQLGDCAETHLQENAAYFQFFRDVDDTGKELSAARDSLNQAYACDASTDVPRLESLLQQTHTEQRLVPLKGKVHELVGRSQSVLNLKPRRPGHPLKGPVTITAITDYTQPEPPRCPLQVTVKKDQEYELKDNSDATRWRVASVGRKDATVPSVCFVLPSPNPDALQAAERLRQQHKDLLAAWNGKTADLRSLLAWHHLLQYTKIIRAWDLPTLKKLALGQKEEALKELERRRQAFLEERAASQAPGDAETAQAEAEVSTCKQHVAQLEASMHSGEHPLVAQLKAGMHSEEQSEAACARCVAALRDLRRRLGEKEERVAAGCRGGLQGDHEQHSGARVAQHEDLQKELEALAGELEQLQHEGAALLALSPAPPSSGALRSELPLAAQQRERADALLLLLVQRLRAMGEVVSSSRDSERCLGALEVRLAQEPAAVMDPDALNASVRNLKAIAADAAEPLGTALDAAGAALQRAEGADGPLAQAAGGHADPDLASYRERDARLRGRAKQLQTELAARLGDLEALSKKTAKFHEIHLWLMQLLERSGEKQKGLLAADKPDSQSVTLLLEQQKALVDELEKAQNKVDECRKSAEECASHVQKYDTRVSTYRTSVEKQLKTPAQWPAGSNVAEDLNKARSDLVGRYGTILGHAKQQVGFLSDDLKRIQDAEQATAQLNSQSQEEKLEETLKNAKVPQTFKGRNWTIWELLHSNYFTDEEKKMFLVDFQSGKRTMDEYYIYIIQFLQQKEKQRKKKEITFNGLRQEVTLEELVESEIIDENTAEQLIEGTKSVTDVSPSIERYLGGGRSIAGLYVEATKEKMPIDAAIKKNLLTLGTGMVLLEAQAATGSMIDPLNNTKLSVDEAVQKGLVSPEYQEKLRLAERAVTGYTDPITKKTISLFEAMEKEIILKQHGIRILEAQIATGGIIDPQNSHRLPIEVAYKRGLFDKTLHAALLDPSDDTKGFFDPNTTKNLTYLQLMKTCITDPDTGLCLLPLKVHEVKDVGDKATLEAVVQGTEQQLQTATHESIKETLKTTNVDITIKGSPVKKMTLEEIFASDLISDEDKDRLMKDFTSGKITIQEWIRLIIMFIKRREDQKAREEAAKEKVEDAVAPVPAQKLEHAVISEKQLSENFQKATVELPFGGHGDKKFSVAEIFQSGMIDEDNKKKLVEDYKSGKITFEQLILYIIEIIQVKRKPQKYESAPIPEPAEQQIAESLKTTIDIHFGRFAGKKPSIEDIFKSGLVNEGQKKQLLEDYKLGNITMEQLIMYIVQIIQQAEASQRKPEKQTDKTIPQTELRPDVPTPAVGIPQKEGPHISSEELAVENLKKTTLDLPFGSLAGKKYTLQEIFEGDLIDKHKKDQLMRDYKSGKISLEELMIFIIEIIRLKEREKTKKSITFHGIRTDVTVDDLVKSGLLKEDVANQLADGLITQDEVQKQVGGYLGGSSAIAGLYVEGTKETMSLYDGFKKNLIKTGTGLVLLEAQAASGFIIDPVKNEKLSVEEAVQKGVVGPEYKDKLLSAERAVTGYKDKFSGATFSVFQAMKNKLILKQHGIRLLEAQIATGGIIDPQASHRLPVEAAYKRGLFDEEMNQILSDPSDDTKGFFDPNTEENLTYMEQMQRCIIDPNTGLTLLPIKEKKGKRPEKKVPTQKEVAKATDDAQKLAAAPVPKAEKQEDVEALKKTTVNIQLGRFAGKNPSLDELLQSSLIPEEKRNKLLEDYKSGRISKDQLILYIIEFITTAESEQYKPEKSSEEPVLKAAETIQSVLPDSVPLKPTTVPAEELQAIERLKKKTVDLPFGKFAGKKYTLQDIFDSDLVDEDKKKQLMVDYKTGKITLEQLMLLIIEIIRLNERERTKKAITFHGIRTDVTVDNLVKSGVLKEDVANQLADGLITKDDVQKQVRKYLGGSNAIAGLYIEKTKETMSLYDGLKKKLIKLGTGLVLLEAQAASGFIIDPVKDQKLSVEEAVQKGVVGREYQDKLLSAERAVTGYKDPFSKEKLSLFQAMKKELILKAHGIRLLEAQIATGGIIDPQASHRLPVEAAYKRGLFDEEMNQILSDPSDDTKGFFDPNTEENLTYMEQMQRCIIDPDTGLTLLPIKEKKGKGPEKKVPTQKEVAKATDDAQKLAAAPVPKAEKQEDVKALKKTTVNIQVGRFAGKNPSLNELLQSGLIAEEKRNKLLEDYKSGRISKDQLILYIIEFITTAESEQYKPAKSSEEPVLKAAETVQSVLPDSVPLKPTTVPAEELQAIERLKKKTVDLPFGKFAGKKYTLQDIFDSDLVDEDKKKQLMVDYKTGKITLEQLMFLIIEIIHLNEREKTKKAITFHGIRTDVTVDNLVKSGVLKEDVANQLADGLITKDDVQKQVRKYLGGSNAIAGLYIEKTKETMSLYDGLKKKLIKLGTGLVLLEAQAASGFIIDPVKDQKLSVEEAVQKGVVGREYQDKLLSAERAVTGYKDPFSKETLSLFQAMKKELILKAHGIRLLEAQIATGGIIDPQASHRLPVEAAYKRGLFDEEMNQILSDPSDDTKGFFDPNTEENLTYMEQMQRCIIDPDTGLTLLPIKEKKGKGPEKKVPTQKEVAKATDDAQKLAAAPVPKAEKQEDVEALKKMTVSIQVGRFAGKKPSLDELLQSGLIAEENKNKLLEDYKSGKISKDQLILYIIEFITTAESEQQKPKQKRPARNEAESLSPHVEDPAKLVKTTVDINFGRFAGKNPSLDDIFLSGLIADEKKNKLLEDYKLGKINKEQLILYIIEIIQNAEDVQDKALKASQQPVRQQERTPQKVEHGKRVTTIADEKVLEDLKNMAVELPFEQFAGKNASLLDVLDSDLVESDKKQQLIEDYKLGKITLQELYILIIEIVQRKSKPEKIKAKTTDPASPLKEIEVTKTVEPSTKLVAKSPKQDLSMSFENTTVELPFGMFAGKKASLKDIFESDLIDADKKNALTEDYSSGKITLEQLLFFVIEYVQAKELGTQEMKKKYLDVTEIDTPVQKHTPLVTKTVVTSTRKEGASAETTEALKQTTIDLPFGKFAGKNPSLQEILESDIIEDDKKEQLMNDYTSGKITLEQLLFFIIEIIQAKEGGKAGEKVLLKRLPEETGKPASSSVTSLVTKTVVTTTRREGLSPEQEALESLSRTTVKLPIGKYSDKSMSLQEILDSGEIEDAKKKELIDDYKIGKITLEQLLVLIIEIIQAKELGGTGHKVVVKKVTAEKQTPEDNGESSSSATQTVIKKTVVTTTSKAGSSPEDALETLKRTTIDLPIGKFAGKKMSLQEILDGGEIDEDKRKELMEDYKKGKINLEQLLVFIIEIIQAKESGTAQPKIVVKKMTSEPSDSADVDEPTSTSRSVVTKTVVTTRRQEGLSPEQEALESLSRTTVKLPIGKYSDKSMSLQEILDGGEIEDAKKKELIDDYKIGKITLEQLLVLIIEIIQAKELGGTGHKVVVKKVTAEKQTPEDNGESSSSATQTIIKKTVVTTTSKAGSSPEEALETLKRTTIDLPIGKFAGKKMSLQEILDGGEIDEDKRKELMEDYKKGKINLEQLLVFIIEIIQAKESGTAQPKIVVKKMTSEPSDSADVDEPTSTSRSVVTKTVVTTRRQEGLSPEQEALESLSRTTVKLPIGKYSDKSMSLQEILDGGEIEDAKKKELIDDYKTGKITLEQLLVLIIEIIQAKELGGTGHKVVVKKVTAEKQTPEDNGESSSSATQTVIKKTVVTTTSKAGSSPEEDALDTLKRTTIDLPIGKFAGKKMSLQEILDGGEIDEDKRKELMEDYKKGKINLEQLLVFIIEIIQAKESGTAQPKIVVKKMTSEPSDSADVDEPTSTSRSVVTKTVVTTRRQEGLSPEQEALESLSRTTVKLPIGKYSDKSMSLQEILDGGEIEDAKRKELIDDYKIGKITLEQLLVLIIEIIQAKELGGTGHKVVVKKVTAEKQTPEDNGESSSSATQTVIKKTVVTTTSKAGSSPEEDALDTLKRTTIDLPIGKFAGKKMSLQEILDGGEIDEDKRKELMEDYKKGKINLEQLLVFIIDIIQAKESGTAQPKIVVKKMTSEPSDSADVDEPTSTSRSVVTKTVVTTRRQEGLSPEQEALESLSRTTVKLPIGKYSDKSMSLQEILDGGEIEDAKKKELIDDYKIGKITLEQLLVLIIEIIQAKELGGTGHKVVVKKVTAEKQTPEDNGESSSSESQTVIKKTVVTTTRADSSSPEDALETLKRTTIDLPIGKFAGKKMSLQEILDGGEIDDMKRKELIDNYKSGKITLEQLLVFMIEFIQAKGSGVSGPKVTVKKVTAEKSSSSEIEDPTSPSRVASVVTKTVVTTTRKEGLSPEQEVLESLSRTTVKLPVGRFSNKSMSLQDILDSGEIDDVKRQELIDNYKTGKITLQDLLVYIIEIIQAKELGETGHKVVLKKVTAEKYTPEETADPRSTQTVVRKTVVTTTRKDDSSTGEDVMEMLKRTTVDLPVGRFAGKKMTIMDILESGLLETDEKQKLLDDYKSGKINIQDLLMSIVHIVQEKELGQTGQKISFKTVTAEKRVSETAQYTHSASAEENVEQSLQRTTVTLPIGKFSGQKISLLEVLDSGEIDEEKKTQLINDYKSGKINLEQLLLIIIEIIQTKESGAKHKVMIKQNTPESLAMGETESSLAVSKQTVVTSTVVQTSSVQGASPQEIVEHLKKTSIDVSFGRFAGKKPSVQDILDSGLIDPGKKQQLMNDLRSGKITIEQLLIIIIEIIHKKEGEQVSREELAVKKVPAVVVQEARDEPSDSKSARKVLTVAQVEADLKSISIELPSKTFSNKKVTVQELFASDTIEESKKKQLMEDYRTGKITQQQLIILIIEIITSTGKGISSKEKYVFSEEQATQNFSNTTVDVPVGKFSGKKVTIQELFQTDLIDSEKKKQLIQDYRSGKITLQVLIIIIIEIIEKREKEIKKSPITFKGFRRQVTISELMDSGLINETTASKLKDGSVSVNEVSESLKVFLEGTSSIAGVFVDRTKEILSIYAAMKRGLIRPGTAFELLEAQAATGYIIDPVKKQKLLVEEAIKLGVVGEEFKDKLLSAERAVTGYKDPYTDQKISIFQAMKKQMIVKNHGIRLLEAQIATGGIIDPHASHRIPVELAYKRGLFDEEMNQILLDPSDDTKGFFDPNTEENLTYMELLQRCSKDSSGLYLLMLKDKKPERKMSSKSSVRKRKIIVVDPDTGKEMTVYEAYMKGLIDQPTYLQLSAQESEWEEITITSSDGVTTSLLVDRKSGRQFSIDESLAEGVINEQTVQLYRSGKMTIFELGDQLSGTSSGSRSRSSSFGASSVPASPQAGSKVPSVPWSDPTEETVPIGGILDLQKFEKISITEAIRRNLVDTITGQRLLEAQACTGGIINPATGGRCSIPEAVTQGLLDKYMADKLNQANKAYHGFEDLRTKAIFHTGQAMKKGLLFQEAGTRIFEVQYLTGGIIDSGKPERIQLDEAVEKGIVDNYTAKKIRDVNSHLKYLVCPKTKARITFKDALDRSMTDEETGVRLLEASGLTSRYSASTPSSGFGSRSGSRPGSRRGSFDATGSGTPSTFLSPSSYTSTSFSRR